MENRINEALDIVRRAKALGGYDSNVIGMAAEIIAEEEFGMKKTAPGAGKSGGRLPGGESVQIKGWACARVQEFEAETFFRLPVNGAEKLLAVLIYSRLAEYEILYFGESEKIGAVETVRGREIRRVSLGMLKTGEEINAILQKIRGN